MLPWLKRAQPNIRETSLPGGAGTIAFPRYFQVELENEETLLAFDPADDSVTFRVSSVSFASKERGDHGAFKCIQDRAAEHGLEVRHSGGKAVIAYSEEFAEEGASYLAQYWEIGAHNTIVILSATVTQRAAQSTGARTIRSLVPAIIDSIQLTQFRRVLALDGEAPEGVEVSEAEPHYQTHRALTPEETEWLKASLAAASALAKKYEGSKQLDPRGLDRIYSRWRQARGPKEPGELVVDALGAAFGQHLVRQHGFAWEVVSDPLGQTCAVRHAVGQTTAFPHDSIQKRLKTRQENFLTGIYQLVLEQIQ